jgi:hypothetical protein
MIRVLFRLVSEASMLYGDILLERKDALLASYAKLYVLSCFQKRDWN